MKKFRVLICTMACLLGLTACGEKQISDTQEKRLEGAKEVAVMEVLPMMEQLVDPEISAKMSEYTAKEIESIISDAYNNLIVDGNGVKSAIDSFQSGLEEVGAIQEVKPDSVTATLDGTQIVVRVGLVCEKKNAEAEVILENDFFFAMKSASLNPETSVSDLMKKAGLNTLIGMSIVFIVLILISLIISLFGYIPKIQKALENKKKAQDTKDETPKGDAPVITEADLDYADDSELVAVIAAAIAAYEGSAGTDGFVVRSIRKANKR